MFFIRLLFVVNYAIKWKIMHNVLTTETKVKTINSDKNKEQMINFHMHVHACVCVCVCRSFPFPWLKMARGNKSGNGQPRLHCSCQLPETESITLACCLARLRLMPAVLWQGRAGQDIAVQRKFISHTHTHGQLCVRACVLKVSVCLAA